MANQELKNEYEIAFLLKDQGGEVVLEGVLKQFGAEISYKSAVATVNLAYPIKKRRQASFGFMNFSLLKENSANLTKALNLSPLVLRTLVISQPVNKLSKTKVLRNPKMESRVPMAAAEEKIFESAPSGGILSNEALEKKLEEILK